MKLKSIGSISVLCGTGQFALLGYWLADLYFNLVTDQHIELNVVNLTMPVIVGVMTLLAMLDNLSFSEIERKKIGILIVLSLVITFSFLESLVFSGNQQVSKGFMVLFLIILFPCTVAFSVIVTANENKKLKEGIKK